MENLISSEDGTLFCPSCGGQYQEGISECVDCRVPLTPRPPEGTERRRARFFSLISRISRRPFFLELWGLCLGLAGGFALLNAMIAVFEPAVSGPAASLRGGGPLVGGLLGIGALAVAYAIWWDHAWSRPALLALILLTSANRAPSVGTFLLQTVPTLALALGYLYLWPNTVRYYRRLREPGGDGDAPLDPAKVSVQG